MTGHWVPVGSTGWHGSPSGVTSSHGLGWQPGTWQPIPRLVFPPVQNSQMPWVSFQRAIHCFTPFCLQFLSKYGREIPCYEPTVYTENDGVGSYTTQDWIESWMISQNGYNRPNLTELEAQCQELGCDPFCSRCFNQKKTTLRVSLLIHCLQSGWRLYNVYSDKQWRRSNSGPWVEVLRAGFSKKLFSKWQNGKNLFWNKL